MNKYYEIHRKITNLHDLGLELGDTLLVLDKEEGSPTGLVAIVVTKNYVFIDGYGFGSLSDMAHRVHSDRPHTPRGTMFFALKSGVSLYRVRQLQEEKKSKKNKLKSA